MSGNDNSSKRSHITSMKTFKDDMAIPSSIPCCMMLSTESTFSENQNLAEEIGTRGNHKKHKNSLNSYKMPDISKYLKSGKTVEKNKNIGDHNSSSTIKNYM